MSRENYPHLKDKENYWYKVKDKIDLVEGWARAGFSMQEIAEKLHIGGSTFKKYLKQYPELQEAVDRGRYHAETLVENSLFRKATGYVYKEVTKERTRIYDDSGSSGEYKLVVTKEVIKTQAPDTQAAIYWLEHRAPNRWKKLSSGLEEDDSIEVIIKRKVKDSDAEEQS